MVPADDDDLTRIISESVERDRGYASYWTWPLDRQVEERCVAEVLINYLRLSDPTLDGILKSAERGEDPPDVILQCKDGRRIGIEVTELVSSDAVEAAVRERRSGRASSDIYANWTPELVADALSNIIASKDRKLAEKSALFDRLILVVFTDEMMINFNSGIIAAERVKAEPQNLSASYLLLSYDPKTDDSSFPNKCAVITVTH